MKKVLGMGNALVDILMQLKDESVLQEFLLPKGSMQLVDSAMANKVEMATLHFERSQASGGSAANTIHGLANLGIKTGYLGKIGRDHWGEFFKLDMQRKNIDTQLLLSQNESGRAIALISPDSERTFATFLGAAVELSAEDLPLDLFTGYAYFHVEGYLVQNRKLIEEALKRAKDNGLIVSLDLASFNVVEDNRDFLHEMTGKYVDILFANEEEAKAYTREMDDEKALDHMAQKCEIAILKKGAKGSLIRHLDKTIQVGVVQAKSIDTTGAGDLYAAGFLYGLLHTLPLQKCGEIGALLAAKVIEVVGPKMDESKWEIIREDIERIKLN
jgi:sugar/nucleoside kinase (ribokinase family)